jgi:hypothetical protein
VVGRYLDRYAGADPGAAALAGFLDLAARLHGGSGPGGRTWRRDDLYDRPALR